MAILSIVKTVPNFEKSALTNPPASICILEGRCVLSHVQTEEPPVQDKRMPGI